MMMLLVAASCRTLGKTQKIADLILINGNIITVEENFPEAEALAVKGDRIMSLGKNDEILKYKGEHTKVIDVEGRTVIPGLIDAHMHFIGLGEGSKKIYLDKTTDYQQVLDIVQDAVKKAKPGEWIMGSGWHTANWKNKEYPDNSELDRISQDHPVFLSGMATHAALVNKKALALAGITRATPDPEGGRILRNPISREPTGLLLEKAQQLVTKLFPSETDPLKKEKIRLSTETAWKMGLTSIHDPGVDGDMIRIYKELLQADALGIRLNAMFLISGDGASLDDFIRNKPEIGLGNNRLTLRCIKFLIDGALGARGAALLTPYNDKKEEKGLIAVPQDEVDAIVKKCLSAGYQVAMHAIGDYANRIALNAVERAMKEVPTLDPRIRIEHAQILAPEDIPRFSRLGVIASMQPIHCPMDMAFAEFRVGQVRMKGAYAWMSLIESGAIIAGGSDVPDFPIEYSNPFWGIYAAITRQDLEGNPQGGWYPEQKVSRLAALKMFTIHAAYAAFEENLKGSLAPGKLADLVIISNDILAVPERELLDTEVLATILGGKVVYTNAVRPAFLDK
jgi:predicted amidohydrolase YtcJ